MAYFQGLCRGKKDDWHFTHRRIQRSLTSSCAVIPIRDVRISFPRILFIISHIFFSCVVYVLSQKKRGRNREKKKNFYWKMGAATLLCPIESRGPNTRRDLARYVQCISFGFRVRAQKGTAQNLPRPVNNPFTLLFRLFFFFFFFLLRTGDCIHIYWFHYFPHTLLLADLWLTDFFSLPVYNNKAPLCFHTLDNWGKKFHFHCEAAVSRILFHPKRLFKFSSLIQATRWWCAASVFSSLRSLLCTTTKWDHFDPLRSHLMASLNGCLTYPQKLTCTAVGR